MNHLQWIFWAGGSQCWLHHCMISLIILTLWRFSLDAEALNPKGVEVSFIWAPAKTSDILEQLHQDIDTWYHHETLRNDRGDTKNDDSWYTCSPDFIANIKSSGTMRDTQKTMTISATSFRTLNLVGFLGYFLAKYVGKYLANFDGIEMLTGFFGYFRSWRHELNPPFLWEPTYHRVHCYIFWILVPHPLSPGVAGTEEAIGILMVSPPELGNRWLPISRACWR